MDENDIVYRDENTSDARMKWNELQQIVIQTTPWGPWAEDVLFVLIDRQGNRLVIPQEAKGSSQLFERLQQLDGFDNEAAVAAFGCTDNQTFHCWESRQR